MPNDKFEDKTHDDHPSAQADEASAEVQAVTDDANEKGYIGKTHDPNPNEAYSLETGPDSPLLVPDNKTRFAQPSAESERDITHG